MIIRHARKPVGQIAAQIKAGFPRRVYYVSLSGFYTHSSQAGGRRYLLIGLVEALHAFQPI
jgi:uncharacterized protein (DUF1501 family)